MSKSPEMVLHEPEIVEDPNIIEKGRGDVFEENEALKRELAAKSAQLENLKGKVEAEFTVDPAEDDRTDLVDVSYGLGGNLQTYRMPKSDAVEALVRFYSRLEVQIVPRRDTTGNGKLVNDTPCYVRFRGRNIDGIMRDYIKDLPLYLVAERIIDHPKWNIQLVSKPEYEAYEAKGREEQEQWEKPLKQKKIEKAVETLASFS